MPLTLLEKMPVINEWAISNNYEPPIYDPENDVVLVAGLSPDAIDAFTATIDAPMIADAAARKLIRNIQLINPKPENATLEESKAWSLLIAGKVIAKLRNLSTANADSVTLTGWVDKLAIAEKIAATTATPDEIAIIQAEADMRGLSETAAQLADKIILKGNALRTIRSTIDGFEDKLKRDIAGITDGPTFTAVMDDLILSGSAIITNLGA